MRRPLVLEVSGAYAAFEKAALDLMYPDGVPAAVMTGVLYLHSAVNRKQRDDADRSKAKAG